MIFEVIVGLTILGEGNRYSTSHLIGISFGMIISISGIFVLGCKKNLVEAVSDDKAGAATESGSVLFKK